MSKNYPKNSHITRKQKRTTHKKHSKNYIKVYSPYLPALLIFGLSMVLWAGLGFNSKNSSVLSAKTELSNQNLLKETNERRLKNNSNSLKENTKLNAAAHNKAIDMAKRDYWSHETPEGKQPWFFIENQQYKYSVAEENLAYGFNNANAVINGWMNSPSHKEAMLSNKVSEVGFGIAHSENYQGKGSQYIIVAYYAEPTVATVNPLVSIGSVNDNRQISFVESINVGNIPFINLFAGLILGASLMFIILRHGLKIRKKIKRGEKYIIHHPVVDITVIAVIIFCIVITETAGFIY